MLTHRYWEGVRAVINMITFGVSTIGLYKANLSMKFITSLYIINKCNNKQISCSM